MFDHFINAKSFGAKGSEISAKTAVTLGSNKITLDSVYDFEVGDEVLTSGLGSVYPRDLVIGTVVEVKTDSYSREKIAIIEWSVDVDSLKYVMIVTDKGTSPVESN